MCVCVCVRQSINQAHCTTLIPFSIELYKANLLPRRHFPRTEKSPNK